MKNRIIQILQEVNERYLDCTYEQMADALIEAGVILPRFKTGQTAWYLSKTKKGHKPEPFLIVDMTWSSTKGFYYTRDGYIGHSEKTLYSTEAEALATLEGQQ